MQHLYSPLLLIVFVFRTLWLEFHSHDWKPIWLDGSEETLFADCWRGECHYKEQHLAENDDFCFHRVTRSFVVRSAEERYYWLTLGTATEYPRGKLDRLQETRHSMRQSKKHTKANAPRLWKFVTFFFKFWEDRPTNPTFGWPAMGNQAITCPVPPKVKGQELGKYLTVRQIHLVQNSWDLIKDDLGKLGLCVFMR